MEDVYTGTHSMHKIYNSNSKGIQYNYQNKGIYKIRERYLHCQFKEGSNWSKWLQSLILRLRDTKKFLSGNMLLGY